MTVTVYVEGGGKNNQDTRVRCKEGFTEYCAKLCPSDRHPKIVACGSREDAFNRFTIAVGINKANEQCALLVDAEGPVSPHTSSISYLHISDGWAFTNLLTHQVFLMVQAMEAWFLADRNALAAYYGPGFRVKALPGSEHDIEVIPKNDLEAALKSASRTTKTKGQYHKTRHAFALLAEIDPKKVEAGSPHAAEFHKFLRSL